MKNILYIIVLLCFSQATLIAQYRRQDSTKAAHTEPSLKYYPIPKDSPQSSPSPAIDNNNKSVDPLIQVRLDALPVPMRKALEREEYKGWEESPMLRDPKTLEYSIDIRSGDTIKTYHFDRLGNPKDY